MPHRIRGASMLDVDGQVISAEVLAERVEQLLGAIDTSILSSDLTGRPPAPSLDAPIHAMRVTHSQMHPPGLGHEGGLRGRVGTLVKRVVRKLTSWYVEPRWILQQQIDSQN